MLAALPRIEADAKASGSVGLLDLYGLMTDRTRLSLGEKQVYGSQLDNDAAGRHVVVALEDPCHVDDRRAALKQPPLAEYIKQIREYLLNGEEVAVPDLEAAYARDECAPSNARESHR
jgi:hypothetical protein